MLEEHESYNQLNEFLLPYGQFTPHPKAGEREVWEAVSPDLREEMILLGEKSLSYTWPALTAIRYMDYFVNGNRHRYERASQERRNALLHLVLAECLEFESRFMEQIVNGIWSICEESSWVAPAHLHQSSRNKKDGLPDVTDPVIDLMAAETAGLLTWTWYLLEDQLERVSPVIRRRVFLELQRRIVQPYLTREQDWWMGFTGHHKINNWNPWINANVMAVLLLCEPNEQAREEGLRKAMRSLDTFLRNYPLDGGCDEGPGYWSRAGGSLFECLELLHGASEGRISFYHHFLIREIGRYVYRAHIDGYYFVNYGDTSHTIKPFAELIFRFGMRIHDARLTALGHSMYRHPLQLKYNLSLLRVIPSILHDKELRVELAKPPLVRDVWLGETQFMAAREQEGSSTGLYLAVKGGNNGESHNHNDVGHFLVYADGKPFLIDVGVETYARQTFSQDRYQIWTMRSLYHNLPSVDGEEQSEGARFAAKDIHYYADEETAGMSFDIAGAYPENAGIQLWDRACILMRGKTSRIEIKDSFRLSRPTADIRQFLMTPYEPHIEAGTVTLTHDSGLQVCIRYDADQLTASYETIDIEDPKLRGEWGLRLYRIILQSREARQEGSWALVVEKVNAHNKDDPPQDQEEEAEEYHGSMK